MLAIHGSAVSLGPVAVAENPWTRMRGLLGRATLGPREGMLITRCKSVHTFGMRYPIDVIFFDKLGSIEKIVTDLQPSRVTTCLKAAHVLEMRSGESVALGLEKGTKLSGW